MKRYKLLSVMAMTTLLWGCYPAGPEYVEELDVVYTTSAEDYDFDSKSTYAMPDEIVIGVDIDRNGDTTIVYMKDIYANQILSAIEDNMSDYGWERVDIDESPDMLLTPAGMSNTNYFYSWWYDYWWYGYWDWWGWYYPPYVTVSSYTTGTFTMALADPEDVNPLNQSPTAWLSISNGVLSYGNDIDRAIDAVNKSFAQSPYLQTN